MDASEAAAAGGGSRVLLESAEPLKARSRRWGGEGSGAAEKEKPSESEGVRRRATGAHAAHRPQAVPTGQYTPTPSTVQVPKIASHEPPSHTLQDWPYVLQLAQRVGAAAVEK
jgi:hypothetical protein